ncbi:prepilin-type N-terminal cleavage/methylation domain-containing protein [Methylosinus sp. KRF6]|uniref:prepilin-type N-terminal cleavage/methylation domain-containing protein n=1 Tax=Methylosinus sp. KRF6 TaxID=2846853 RepID=UPI001C0DC61F|nr:prepilin-type N-terminal cleavage/methylation domain-containing protein [Methylosinus sp. KRF6]MBU3887024.1 prepilin-type N-terminal cleavage/methylation domain-containing protein [Methylosinus sp. KRF6]
MRGDANRRRAGFTLVEALVALAVLVAFAGALGPNLFHARRILASGKGRVNAALLLRSLIAAPFDRENGAQTREGETGGFRWRVAARPIVLDTPVFDGPPPGRREEGRADKEGKEEDEPKWTAYRVEARVVWGEGQAIAAETIRLAKAR